MEGNRINEILECGDVINFASMICDKTESLKPASLNITTEHESLC